MLTKKKLIEILEKLQIHINEGIQSDLNTNKLQRIVFWEFVWEALVASQEEYNTKVTYQISFFSQKPRDEKLLELRNILKENKEYPIIEHEYVQKDKCFHSYFSLEVLEDV